MNNRHSYQHTIAEDIYLGAIYGDFAPEMGGAGRLIQIILGFVPFIGTVCAIRDFFADVQQRDTLGALLNAVAAIPVFGGLAKVAKVVRAWRLLGRPTPLAVPTERDMLPQEQEKSVPDAVWPLS